VQAFLEQCLYSLQHAITGLDAEVWVVDNASRDGSVEHLRPAFPWVHWVENKHNVGFSKANNQVLSQARGESILFLNPDTLVPENCLKTCIDFLEKNPDTGALGVKMIDGGGNYLPESKRGNPGIFTSLCKLTGLHHLFPSSRLFARYYMGHLPSDRNNPVEVLAGAFMMVRKTVIETTGGFDERFFMYGEDIDLSYRINQTRMPGNAQYWQTWYLADAPIVHFKGESTKRGSLNYVRLFYKAMVQFVQKHYASGAASVFRVVIYAAIGFRALLAGFVRLVAFVFNSVGKLFSFIKSKSAAAKGLNYISFTYYNRAFVIGEKEDEVRIEAIFKKNEEPVDVMIWEGTMNDLQKKLSKQDMVIWCGNKQTTLEAFMKFMGSPKNAAFLFHYPGSNSIIGSTHKKKSGNVLMVK
jgi:GT2 family glycosyltransferase